MKPVFIQFLASVFMVSMLGLPVWGAEGENSENSKGETPDELKPGSMILIPEGKFTMGDNDGLKNERPEHEVGLDSYYIDRFEVTMEEFQNFLDENYDIEPPPLWDDGAALGEASDRPAVGNDLA